ncbi:MerR family transcriptional regulator [Paenibacillus ginsengarvi]|uniref:MerR family transcriptional regulator n=1 Tax=Paenibacillus ginsengarvi TaxID=400777 RepID=A0A3B0CHZ0_9BACL|nr:MerR family transcriptional regulator [Paenibacillus ginsengarvi]RKN84993.1 MerR family transcriptional regulator [Paenibacillus ginsengarvi]
MNRHLMKIGDVAKLVGVSIRTLRHYHEIGLLIPGHLTEGGHRLYTEKDIQNLYQIMALKNFGFALEEIRDMLGTTNSDPSLLIHIQLEKANEALTKQMEICKALQEIQQSLENCRSPSVQEMAEIIMMMQMNTKQYLSEEQITWLKLRYKSSSEQEQQREEEWFSFIEQLKKCKAEQIAADAPQVQMLADYWTAFIQSTTGNNAELNDAVHRFHADNSHHQMNYGLSTELFAYLQQILLARKANKSTT